MKSAKLENTSPSNGAAGKCTDCCCDEIRQRRRAPKIYFCTRTHRQIAQIIRELNKTEFNKVFKFFIRINCIRVAISGD